MPRRPRLFVPDVIDRVYCRVARGEFVFDENDEAARGTAPWPASGAVMDVVRPPGGGGDGRA